MNSSCIYHIIAMVCFCAPFCTSCYTHKVSLNYPNPGELTMSNLNSGELYCIFAYRDLGTDGTQILQDYIGAKIHFYRNNTHCSIGETFMRNPSTSKERCHFYKWDDGGPDFWMTMRTCEWSSNFQFVKLTKYHLRRNDYSDYFFYSTSPIELKFETCVDFKNYWSQVYK